MKVEIAELAKNPMGFLLEAIHSAGYSGPLASPLYAPESALDRLNGELLEEFMTENFTAARMVLAASGVEHEELLKVAEPLTSDLPNVPPQLAPKSQYVGGDFRQHTGGEATHFAVAFEVPGWNNEKEAVTATVLQMLMGGGGSFSAGGPGKGMHSWLYRRVLNEYQEVQSCTAFTSIFNDTGLFGIYGCSVSSTILMSLSMFFLSLLIHIFLLMRCVTTEYQFLWLSLRNIDFEVKVMSKFF